MTLGHASHQHLPAIPGGQFGQGPCCAVVSRADILSVWATYLRPSRVWEDPPWAEPCHVRVLDDQQRAAGTLWSWHIQEANGHPLLPACTWCGLPTGNCCDVCDMPCVTNVRRSFKYAASARRLKGFVQGLQLFVVISAMMMCPPVPQVVSYGLEAITATGQTLPTEQPICLDHDLLFAADFTWEHRGRLEAARMRNLGVLKELSRRWHVVTKHGNSSLEKLLESPKLGILHW